MSNDVELKFGILCPECQYGIIYRGNMSYDAFEYKFNGTTRVGMTLHTYCPYCGSKAIITDNGERLAYRFTRYLCEFADIQFVDL